jgi:alkyldihydroxyacetonephosphate synthase
LWWGWGWADAEVYRKSYRDVARALARELLNSPDLVAFPRTENDVVDLLDWAGGAGIGIIPFGGGSSVVEWSIAVLPIRP